MLTHKNRIPFSGTLLYVDQWSEGSPIGTDKRRVYFPRDVAFRALPTLLGMGVNVSEDFSGHNRRNKCGVITRAGIEKNALVVEGFMYGRDYPEVIERLGSDERFGMSFEGYGDDNDMKASVSNWVIKTVVFTGATIMLARRAAFKQTVFKLKGGVN